MREMKDSGLKWIGQIPNGWEVNRIKYLFKTAKGLSVTKDNLIEEGLPVISYGQIHSKINTGVIVADELRRFVSYDYRKYVSSKLEKFDFAFVKWILLDGRSKKYVEQYHTVVKNYSDKTIILKNQRQLNHYMKQVK